PAPRSARVPPRSGRNPAVAPDLRMTSRARLCLNMIVRNEAAIIERCLASVAPVIDHRVICDTGSTDDTPERIETFFRERGIDGTLVKTSFVDFGTTRNEALDACRNSSFSFD